MSNLNNPFTLRALSSWVFRENIHRYEAIPPLFPKSMEEETSFLCSLSGHYTLVEGEIGGMLESTFREFTITENTKKSLFCSGKPNSSLQWRQRKCIHNWTTQPIHLCSFPGIHKRRIIFQQGISLYSKRHIEYFDKWLLLWRVHWQSIYWINTSHYI